jgi:DNA-binding MarR family transcriptional regulator
MNKIVKREEIIQAITGKIKDMSTETIIFHEAVANILSLHITDHKSLDLIHQFGSMPAGKLAELTGLTTGAVTGIIDRLEKEGYVRRTNDPKDRRRIIVEPTRNRKLERKIELIFKPVHERMYKLLSSYTDTELTFFLNAMTKLIELTHEECKRLCSP